MILLTRYTFFHAIFILFNLVWCTSAFACKYTVRDIGFTDLGPTEYRLYLYVNNMTPKDIVSGFERLAYAAFLDANVEAEIINIDRQTDHPAMQYFGLHKIISMPAAVLAGQEGNTLMLPFSFTNEKFNESIWRLLENVVSSPLRSKIINLVKNRYGAVLLIKGNNNENNRQAEQTISGANKDISQVLKLMPKPIEGPPQMIVISEEDFSKEKVLLWSLNAGGKETGQTQVVILYGRGRRIGPVLKGKEITRDNIFSLLAIIGADCECGLDRSVMLGKMIPLRWEKEIQAELSHQLGFDVENPIIKMEMSQILSLSPDLQEGKNSKSPLSAYREGIIRFDSVSSSPTVSSNLFRAPEASESHSTDNFIIYLLLYSTGGILTIVLVFGCFVFLRAKMRRL